MPRVAPSQVVAVIERWFPLEIQRDRNFSLQRQNAGQLMAIIDLVEQIPQELITLDSPQYNDLVIGLNVIRSAFPQWQSRTPSTREVPGYDGTNPLTLIHQALMECPDQAPSPKTSDLNFIHPDEFRRNLRLDISSAHRALGDNEWKSATVLAGSVVEALLLWGLQQKSPKDIQEAVDKLMQKEDAITKKKVLEKKPPNELNRWDLHEFIEVAAELNMITPATASQVRLAKDFRNLIHPGRALRLQQICDRATALSALAAVEHVIRDLT